MKRENDQELFYGPSLTEVRPLVGRRALVVGQGAVGSHVARLLALSGMSLVLVDSDHLSVSNLHRHALPRAYLGWNKARAMADQLSNDVPQPQEFIAVNANVQAMSKADLARLVESADLVVAATGSPAADRRLNELCREHGVPLLRPGVFQEGTDVPRVGVCTGQVHVVPFSQRRSRGWAMGCVECVQQARSGDPAGQALDAQPGTITDVGIVAQYTAYLGLALLRPESGEGRLLDYNLNRNHNFFVIPSLAPRLVSLSTERRAGCDGCLAPEPQLLASRRLADDRPAEEARTLPGLNDVSRWTVQWSIVLLFVGILGREVMVQFAHMRVEFWHVPLWVLAVSPGLWLLAGLWAVGVHVAHYARRLIRQARNAIIEIVDHLIHDLSHR